MWWLDNEFIRQTRKTKTEELHSQREQNLIANWCVYTIKSLLSLNDISRLCEKISQKF